MADKGTADEEIAEKVLEKLENHNLAWSWANKYDKRAKEDFKIAIKLAIAEARVGKYKGFTAEDWEQQFAQAKMVIGDIKKTTGCESDDGVEILESVENLKEAERSRVLASVVKELDARIKAIKSAYVSISPLSRVQELEELKSALGWANIKTKEEK